MKIFNDSAKERISLAYDLFKKEEFLERVFKFMDDSEALILEHERRSAQAHILLEKMIEGAKTKPGPKAKSETIAKHAQELFAEPKPETV
jgi:hypothetical protein